STTTTITNVAPVATITGPSSGAVYAAGTPVSFTGSVADVGTKDTHTATWTFDTLSTPGTVVETNGSGTANATYTFTTAGVYCVTLKVKDDDGAQGQAATVGGYSAMVVIYDPSAGFVTGGGWINSPANAYSPDPTLTGKANFGFVSKYQKGQSVPTGE